MIRLTIAFFVGLLTAVSAAPPNIVFIMADDMGWGDAGVYGQKRIHTPEIDRMAREGLRFMQVYSGHPVCAPSRNVLMTGQHTGHTTIRGNFGVTGGVRGLGGGRNRIPLRAEDVTVAEVLEGAGYVTGITGKWGLGEPGTPGTPNKQGFDEWFGYLNQRRAHTYYPTFLWFNEAKFDLTGNARGEMSQYTHDLFTGFALNFIRRHAGERFFLYVAYTIPHRAFRVPQLGEYADKPWEPEQKAYAAMITRMDADIGRILELLDELGLSERTIVFFTSDNGAADRYDGLFDSAGPFREEKGSVYEGGIRVPMIVRWPGHVPQGETDGETVWYFADFLPTAAELAGIEAPGNIDGVSVVRALLGEPLEMEGRYLYWESHSRGFHQAARRGRWKAVRHGLNAPIELYDLSRDPGEKHDVAAQHTEIVAGFAEYFRSCRTDSEYFPVRR